MIEIFKILNGQHQTKKTEIELESNPQNIIGASMTKELRIVYFENEQLEPFYIDFVPHSGTANTIYLIPSYHLLYLPNSTTSFHCISIPHNYLNDIEKCRIYSLKYKNKKSVSFDTQNIILNNRIVTHLTVSIATPENNLPCLQYIKFAEKLLELIFQSKITHQLSFNNLTNEIGITRKTTHRFCNAIFSISPSNIISYHMVSKIIFIILSNKLNPFSEISECLGFRNPSAFGRYVKTSIGLTPKKIREYYQHINI